MNSSIKKILVPTDFSVHSNLALNYAAEISHKSGAEITLLHVIEPPYNFPSQIDSTLEKIKENSKSQLNTLIKNFKKEQPDKNLIVKDVITTGMTAPEIIQSIDRFGSDLVVMGSRGQSAAKKIFFGSVSTDVLLRSPVPVIAYPENASADDFKHLLFATDFRNGDIQNLEKLTGFAELFNSTIHILHVSESKELKTDLAFRGLKELVAEKFSSEKFEFSHIEHEDILTGISMFNNTSPVSMIVMNRYEKSTLKTLLTSNLTKMMSTYSDVPLMMLVAD
jgi:nucleotide-binding universal stress UspA family protein